MFELYTFAYSCGALAVIGILAKFLRQWTTSRKMAAGPQGIPVLGNVLQVPTSLPWYQFKKWKEQYGNVFSLNLLGQRVVVLGSHRCAADLFSRRADIYSDRPRLIMASEILTGGVFMIFSDYNDVCRKMRRASHDEFSPQACLKYRPTMALEASYMVHAILNNPEAWMDNYKTSNTANILRAVYGWARSDILDPAITTRIHAHTARISHAVVPGAYLVELLPFLKYIPSWLAKWKRDGLEWHERETQMFMGFNKGVEEKVHLGDTTPSFVRGLLENRERNGLSDKSSAWLAGLMFSAGAETTYGTLLNFTMAMLLNPDVAARAQKELDEVVGRERMPTFEDETNLPYIRAIVKETLRWRPVGPMAVPRKTRKDDYYQGRFIPKGATVIPNIWAMNRDLEVYSDPESFRPARFLDPTGKVDVVPPDTLGMGHVTFGFGRRICAGHHFANQALFIQMATLLWAFEFKLPNGEPLPSPDKDIDAGVVVLPAVFKCDFVPRFSGVHEVVRDALGNEE